MNQSVTLEIKVVIPKKKAPVSAANFMIGFAPIPGDCPLCGAASGHWPTCPNY